MEGGGSRLPPTRFEHDGDEQGCHEHAGGNEDDCDQHDRDEAEAAAWQGGCRDKPPPPHGSGRYACPLTEPSANRFLRAELAMAAPGSTDRTDYGLGFP